MSIEEDALKWLSGISDGDARIALNNLQVTIQHCNEKGKIIKVNDIKDGIKVQLLNHIFQSSIRRICRSHTCFMTELGRNIITSFLQCTNQLGDQMPMPPCIGLPG